MSTDLAPAYSPFFGCMGAASAIVFACNNSFQNLIIPATCYYFISSIVQ